MLRRLTKETEKPNLQPSSSRLKLISSYPPQRGKQAASEHMQSAFCFVSWILLPLRLAGGLSHCEHSGSVRFSFKNEPRGGFWQSPQRKFMWGTECESCSRDNDPWKERDVFPLTCFHFYNFDSSQLPCVSVSCLRQYRRWVFLNKHYLNNKGRVLAKEQFSYYWDHNLMSSKTDVNCQCDERRIDSQLIIIRLIVNLNCHWLPSALDWNHALTGIYYQPRYLEWWCLCHE